IDAEFVAGARVEGVVRSEGVPVPGATVRLFLPAALPQGSRPYERGGAPLTRLDDPSEFGEADPVIAPITRTDAEGRYRFNGLIGSSGWEVDVYAEGLSHDRRTNLALVDGETVTLEHELEPAGVVEGVVWEMASIGLRRVGETKFQVSFIAPRQSVAPFSIPGLAPGAYEFFSLHSNVSVEPVFLATVEVFPHRVTWVDLRGSPPHELRGQVRYGGIPQPNAIVDFNGRPVVTDPDGRFRYPFAQRRANGVGITIVAPMIPDAVPIEYARRYDPEQDPYWNEAFDLPAGSLELTLQEPGGSPLEGQVTLRPVLDHDQRSKWGTFWTHPPDEGLVRTARCRRSLIDGQVRFALLPPGRYAVELFGSDVVFLPRTVRVAASEPTVETIAVDPGGKVEVRVVDAAGEPKHEASVYLTYGLGTAQQRSFHRTVDSDGYATFVHAPTGAAIVSLTRGGFGVWIGKQEVTVDPEVPSSVVIQH
ncbi:MAG: carboxypeptidase-like regulatory domain-containing protein, partial [Planctomycetota bacterium]